MKKKFIVNKDKLVFEKKYTAKSMEWSTDATNIFIDISEENLVLSYNRPLYLYSSYFSKNIFFVLKMNC